MISGKFRLDNEMYKKYETLAMKSYKEDFFTKEKIMALCKAAALNEENTNLIDEFITNADEYIKRFMWLYYYILFETEENFENELWTLVDTLPFPEEAELKYPGLMRSCIYLVAADHLKNWLCREGMSDEFLEGYFNRYRYFADLNKTECGTYGLVKLSPFLYGYGKPFMLVIGRLTYQLRKNPNYCELYENSDGKRIMVATPSQKYDEDGHFSPNGKIPFYQNDGNTLTGHTYNRNGCLCKDTITLDLSEYKLILAPGDEVATIHIPGSGKLDEQSVQASLDRAMEIIPRHLRNIKAFMCHTWFIDPNLREIIKEGSNMRKFADRFDVICAEDNENHSLYQHIFQCAKCPLEELVPKNDFQAKFLERAKKGKKIYWSYGVLKQEMNTNDKSRKSKTIL